ncbi:fungal fucose-specific lectin-domain-containing protein [Trametes meyenii]|nr:fungal fucose-specific lectin-domain-containing protein [Trametes meyenii]
MLTQVPDPDVLLGCTIFPAPLANKPTKRNILGLEYAEHGLIGDAIDLTLSNGARVPAIDHKFTLKNGLTVTYGQINGLAGDFYGTDQPISDGRTAQEQSLRFVAAYNTLAGTSPRQPAEAQTILAILQAEVDAVNEALRRHEDPSVACNNMSDVNLTLFIETLSLRPHGFPGYVGLARINWDHFGSDARTAYNAGHATALKAAVDGDLEEAYTMNAFADHFLEDSFSSGHMRTPRRGLHNGVNLAADACAKLMHDEDCAIGLAVENPLGEKCTYAYGDRRALDTEASGNLKRCVAAVQASADEVYHAYVSKNMPSPRSYKAWTIAPTLESARGQQELSPLFRYTDETETVVERRAIIENRRLYQFTTDYWFLTTWERCKSDGRWTYPIRIDGLLRVMPGTNIAVTMPSLGSAHVYYHNSFGGVLESVHFDKRWNGGTDTPSLFNAAQFTPLAVVNWNTDGRDDKQQIRVYHLSSEHKSQENCYSPGRSCWVSGALNTLNVTAAPNTSVAAFRYFDNEGLHIRVYCQEQNSNRIKEFCHDKGRWFRGAVLPQALSGTGIAAIRYKLDNQSHFRVYYQADDLSIREQCLSGIGGEFYVEKAPGRTPIGALFSSAFNTNALDVYWMNATYEVVHSMHTRGRWPDRPCKVVGPLVPGHKFAPDNGKTASCSVLEICKDGPKEEWYSGMTIGKA